jgi:hypothetical protein
MDCRITLRENETFVEMLSHCHQAHEKVAMLLDVDGLSRAEGFIQNIDPNGPSPTIEMEDGQKIEIATISAVNGIFASGYSEC